MKILEVETFGRGGLTHYVENLARALEARGHLVWIATATDCEMARGAPLPANVRLVKVIRGGAGRQGRGRPRVADGLRRKVRALSDALAVARAVRRVRPDIIHLHCTNPVVLAYLALLRLSRAPLVYTAHVVTPHEPIPLQSLIYGLVYRLAPWIVAHSRFDRARLIDEFTARGLQVSALEREVLAEIEEAEWPEGERIAAGVVERYRKPARAAWRP